MKTLEYAFLLLATGLLVAVALAGASHADVYPFKEVGTYQVACAGNEWIKCWEIDTRTGLIVKVWGR